MITVANTTAMDDGSAEHAGAIILPRLRLQTGVILPTRTRYGLFQFKSFFLLPYFAMLK